MQISLPRHEMDGYLMALEDADDLAREGKPQEGYDLLRGAHYRAQELAAAVDAPPWAEMLSQRYELALAQFAKQWRVRPPRARPVRT